MNEHPGAGSIPAEGERAELSGLGLVWKIDGAQARQRFSVVHHPSPRTRWPLPCIATRVRMSTPTFSKEHSKRSSATRSWSPRPEHRCSSHATSGTPSGTQATRRARSSRSSHRLASRTSFASSSRSTPQAASQTSHASPTSAGRHALEMETAAFRDSVSTSGSPTRWREGLAEAHAHSTRKRAIACQRGHESRRSDLILAARLISAAGVARTESADGALDEAGEARRRTAILNFMVQHPTTIDRAFAALADPTRRAVLERLGGGGATISELAEPFGMSLTGMRKHVRLLEGANLVATHKAGRSRSCALVPSAFEGISTWLQRLDRFAQVVQRTKGKR